LGERLVARIAGDANELSMLRGMMSGWLSEQGVEGTAHDSLVSAAHEAAAEAIERGAREVVIVAERSDSAIRLSVAGGDWSGLEELRSKLIRELMSDVRVHRGIVGMRLELAAAAPIETPQ
jgi:hypothetical protein